MKYSKIYAPENTDWCVPATLKTVLETRGIEISQGEIAKNFSPFPDGFEFNIKTLEKFLSEFNLECTFYNPFKEIIESDIFLTTDVREENDVIIAYDHAKLYSLKQNKKIRHLSIFLDYDIPTNHVGLIDTVKRKRFSVPLNSLDQSIHPDGDPRYGFYLIV